MNLKTLKRYLSIKKTEGPTVRVKLPPDLNKELTLLQTEGELYDRGAPSKEELLVAIGRAAFELPFSK